MVRMPIDRRWTTTIALALAFSTTLIHPQTASAQPAQSASETLQTLTVKGKAPKTGYSRDSFGPAWFDVDGNNCNTRDDVLKRDLQERQMDGSCRVLAGVLFPDPYTGAPIRFVRGRSLVDIDHVVALGQAWESGAAQWSFPQRVRFANDPLNLLAVSASANRQKGDREAAAWLPSNRGFRCAYIARQIAVKSKYKLSITSSEKAAMQRVLATCPNEALPNGSDAVSAPARPGAPMIAPTNRPTPPPGSTGLQRFANCTEAKRAGVTPIRKRTNPDLYALNAHMDRDKDGVACE
jgi:hypothetical protein